MDKPAPGPVVIGMDPHKRTVTVEVMTPAEQIIGHERFTTDEAGFTALVEYANRWPDRTWAIERCEGLARHVVAPLLPRRHQNPETRRRGDRDTPEPPSDSGRFMGLAAYNMTRLLSAG